MLKGFFDGSSRDGHGTVILAGYMAEDSDWPEMESAWADALGDGPPMHTADAYGCKEDYKHWNREEAHARINRCVGILGSLDRAKFRSYSCVIPVHEYGRAKAKSERLAAKSIRAFCVDHCVGPMFRQVGADMADPTKNLKQIVFDRNERFLHWMNRVYTAPATRRAWWVPFVAGITAGDSSLILPLQAADVLAWVVGRQQAYADCPEWHATLTVGYPTKAHAVYDCASLVDEVWI